MAWTQIEEIKGTLTSLPKKNTDGSVTKSPGMICSSELMTQIEDVVSEIIKDNDMHPRVVVEVERVQRVAEEIEQ